MTKRTARHCFFTNCKAPATHTVQRLWQIKGRPLPLLHCCDQHVPGSLNPNLTTPFYRVEKIANAA